MSTNLDIECSHQAQTIVCGLNYLVIEAEKLPVSRLAEILRSALREVCSEIENTSSPHKAHSIGEILESDLFKAVQFLNKYAAVSNQEARWQMLRTIEAIETASNIEAANAH